MALRQVLGLCLLCLGAAGVSANVQSDAASPELEKCQFSKKELHTTVRSAAVSALTGICDPVEMEDRLLGMEQRLKHKIEELKETLTKLFIEGVAYDYDDESDAALEQHRYTGATSSSTAAETSTSHDSGSAATGRSSGSGVVTASTTLRGRATQTGANDAYNRIETAAETRRRTSSTRSDSQRRTASSSAGAKLGAGAGAGTAGSKTAGTQRGETRRGATDGYAYKWSSSSRSQSSSTGSNGADTGAGETRVDADRRSSSGATRKVQVGGTASNRTTTATEDGASATRDAQRSGSRRASSRSYDYRWSSSSGGSSGERSGERSRGEASMGVETSSREAAVEEEPGIHSGSRGSSTDRHSHERETSSRRSSVSVTGDTAQEARAIGAGASTAVGTEYDGGKSGSRDYAYEKRASSSSRVTTIDGSDGGAQKSRAIGGASHSERREEARRHESSSSESRRRSQETRTSSQGSSREVAQRRAHESRAIGSTVQTRGDIPHTSGESYSSSHQYSQERGSTSRSSSNSGNEPPYVDFGPGGAPDQQSWFPGTSRTTAGTGVPDLPSASTARVGGVGFGAVGEPLEEDGSSGRSSGAQVRAGDSAYTVGDGSVVFRNKQRYADSAEARRPGSTAGGDSNQYAATNSSWSSSGERQVTAYDASSASRPDGTNVRFLTSYAATQDDRAGAYVPYSGQQSRSSSRHRSRHSSSRSRANRRRVTARRRSRVVDTVSSVSGAESAPLSRYLEINKYNDTVYEENGKQMYSYYWEVNDFPTMMSTWEHQHSLKSPSFYVFRGGYRMYIRVFPSRQGGNVYLHTGLTQGRYDDQLTWPFQMRLRLSLLDHSNLQHDIRSRIWDPRRLCSRWNWQRPRRTDNFECVGLGFPQSLLETQRFLLDDAVLIKLDVFLDD